MKLNVDEVFQIKRNWINVNSTQRRGHSCKVTDRHGRATQISLFAEFWRHPTESKLAFSITKNHWAVGRKMRIETGIPGIESGEYKITWKAESNSWDNVNFLVVEKVAPKIQSPRQALNWLEKQVSVLEAKDGKTTEVLVKEMNVRGL